MKTEEKQIEDGGPAFPHLGLYPGAGGDLHPTPTQDCGMSLRDYFAAKALGGFLANEGVATGFAVENKHDGVKTAAHMCKRAYEFADAMIKQRG